MTIKIDIIRILQAVESEYGTNELLNRIYKVFNINLLHLLDKNLQVTYQKQCITICEKDKMPIYKLELYNEYYALIKIYNGYKTSHYYDSNNCLFRKTASFDSKDNGVIVLDEFDDERFKSRRIIKTTKDDVELLNGEYEKEQLKYYQPPITEEYNHLEDETQKVIKVPGNMYTYFNRKVKNVISLDYNNGFIESSCSINKPNIAFLGRTRNPNELLINSLKTPVANIQIRGRIHNEEILLYSVQILKIGNILSIHISTNTLKNSSPKEEIFNLISKTIKSISSEDIDLLLEYLSRFTYLPFINDLKQELLKIKNKIMVSNQKNIKDIDFFDLKFALFDDFEHLAFDMYENLGYYEEMITKLLSKNTGETPPSLKKVK